jgi:hypothetical protein
MGCLDKLFPSSNKSSISFWEDNLSSLVKVKRIMACKEIKKEGSAKKRDRL